MSTTDSLRAIRSEPRPVRDARHDAVRAYYAAEVRRNADPAVAADAAEVARLTCIVVAHHYAAEAAAEAAAYRAHRARNLPTWMQGHLA